MSSNDNQTVKGENATKGIIGRAQETVGSAVGSTIEAVKERPVTAAAIAGGVAAAAAGAVYGVSKLRSASDKSQDAGPKSTR